MEYASSNTLTDWFFTIFLTLFALPAVSCLALAQLTMRRIEKQIKKDEISHNQALDFGGSRIVTYAYVILLPKRFAQRLTPIIDAELIRSYATKIDWWRCLFFVTSSHLWLAIAFFGFFFGVDT